MPQLSLNGWPHEDRPCIQRYIRCMTCSNKHIRHLPPIGDTAGCLIQYLCTAAGETPLCMVVDCPLGKPLLRPDAELLEAYFREIRCRGWPCQKSLGDTNSEMVACCWNPKTVEHYSPRNKSDRITLLGIPCRSIPECPFGRELQ
ncbi:hypothetical protein O0S10_01595 [Methanocorpusculum sp. MG]|uniref:Uncharacterized protein n=1 Tax=Methanocorpusculum petauri TaxID=3002863 RepID=A0ABT4IFG2_9EURY|nr:hypothetical protein [Methanocorpusculum petauri]MCZ0859920.1 hypothetical protein [Methanocorpusculum petauri]